jgi:hypothetical protein
LVRIQFAPPMGQIAGMVSRTHPVTLKERKENDYYRHSGFYSYCFSVGFFYSSLYYANIKSNCIGERNF